jgi:hypothetical protein
MKNALLFSSGARNTFELRQSAPDSSGFFSSFFQWADEPSRKVGCMVSSHVSNIRPPSPVSKQVGWFLTELRTSIMTFTTTNAIATIDAIDDLRSFMNAHRAIEALAMNHQVGSEESLSHLNRSDLGILLCLVNTSLEERANKASQLARAALNEVRV